MEVCYKDYGDIRVYFREDTSDERVIVEVFEKAIYRRKKSGFDVEPGEKWLDLGANIGAFALYCRKRKALAVECYEPAPDCYQILVENAVGSICRNVAVSNLPNGKLPFRKGRSESDHYRGTLFGSKALPMHPAGTIDNVHGSCLNKRKYDGIKMDIEGGEFGLMDDDLLPKCDKLCMEYHLSRDPLIKNLAKRLAYLKDRFEHVEYSPEFDRFIASGVEKGKTFFDRMIYCWEPK